ncbi:MAG: hypothetical protein ACT4OJ_10785 [Bacteroidota bacterium]
MSITNAEKFLTKVSYISFVHSKPPYVLSFIWEDKDKEIFNNKRNHEAIRDFFRGRKIKFVVHTNKQTVVSIVDTLTADAIVLKGVKFITNNLVAFCEAKLPAHTIFKVNFMCFVLPPNDPKRIATVHMYWADKKTLEVHGYSIIDERPDR